MKNVGENTIPISQYQYTFCSVNTEWPVIAFLTGSFIFVCSLMFCCLKMCLENETPKGECQLKSGIKITTIVPTAYVTHRNFPETLLKPDRTSYIRIQ